jgi:EmrB/QacA subfamily drug resistance transporter
MSPAMDDSIPRRAWLALLVSTIVVFLVVIDISAVNVAFPSIREDFDVSDSQLSWIIGAYNIVVGSLLMLSGRLADSLGRRKIYLPGVAIFGLGSMLCALAPGAGWLIGARVIQAVGGSITLAAGFAVMLPEFPQSRRSTAIGIAGATGALGAVVGPVVGSLLIDLFSWRGIFWLNVPLCILVLIIGPRLLSESSDPNATGRIDLIGVALGTSAVAAIMFSIVQSESWGVSDLRIIALFVLGVIFIPLLLRRSRVHPEPLIDLTLFRYKSFTSANIGVTLYGLGFTAGFLTNSLMLQDVWDMPIRQVGLALAPSPLLATVVSPLTGRWADRIGHRWILTVGCFSCGLGFLLYAFILGEQNTVWTRFVPASLFVGLGIGLTVATWSSAGISDVPQAKFGVAGATYNTLRQAASGLGVSVAITLIAAAGDGTTIRGIRWAYHWVWVAYFAAGLAVMLTFPAGSARDRAERG